jgi:hypothetical protein
VVSLSSSSRMSERYLRINQGGRLTCSLSAPSNIEF